MTRACKLVLSALISARRVPTAASTRKTIRRQSMFQKQSSARKLKVRKTVVGKTKTIFERKIQVSEYFIAQMYLAADLCLDRNYVAIGMLEVSFPIDSLFTLLKSSSVPRRFKAPVCRLIRTLYLDREPQVFYSGNIPLHSIDSLYFAIYVLTI